MRDTPAFSNETQRKLFGLVAAGFFSGFGLTFGAVGCDSGLVAGFLGFFGFMAGFLLDPGRYCDRLTVSCGNDPDMLQVPVSFRLACWHVLSGHMPDSRDLCPHVVQRYSTSASELFLA